MANRQTTFLLKRSNVPGKIPPSSGLTSGELALNTADAILYTSGSTANQILPIGWDRIHRTGDTVFGDFAISGSSLPSGYALSVTGDTNFAGDIYVQGDLNYDGNLIVSGGTIVESGFTANTIYTDYIDFNTSATVAQSVGRINWDSGTGTLNVNVGDSGTGLIDLQVGQEEIVRVFNDEATTLVKGEIVYVSGSQGNRPKVKRALATSDGYSVTTLGMVDRNITSGAEGYVTTFGIISNLNTLGLSGGTPIWLSPTTPGGYTSTKPQAPNHTVLIGYVVRVSATVGSIFVNISNGWELDEIHDVRISAATEGDLLMRSSFSGTPVWVNTKTLNGSYTITGNTNIGGNLTVSGNSGTSWFSSNTSSDLVRITQTGSGNAFVVEDNTNPDSSPFVIDASGNTGIGTLTPQYKLDVSGSSRVLTSMRVGADGNTFTSIDDNSIGISRTTDGLTTVILEAPTILSGNRQIARLRGREGVQLAYDSLARFQTYQSTSTIGLASTFDTSLTNDTSTILRLEGTKTPFLAVAIGANFVPTLSATSNNDTLIGLDINPTFQNSSFTGVTNLGLRVNGNTNIGGNSSSDLVRVTQTGSGNAFVVEDDTNPDSTPFVIDASGNTGIGTLTPQAKLDVSGTTRITGSITSNTITEYFNDWRGTQNISSGLTPFSVTTHTLFAPTISSQATNLRPYALSIVPNFSGTTNSNHAVYISNTNTSPTSPGFNTSLVIRSSGTSEYGQYIDVSGSSTVGVYIDQAQTGQIITRTPSGGIGLSMNRNSTLEVAYTPINTFQQLSGTPSQSIFEYRNISSGNTTEINGLDLLNSSTAKFGNTLGNNAGINLRLGITNSSGLNNRYAKIAAIAPNQSTLPDVIDLGLYVSDTGGTTTNAIYIKGSDQNVGIGITSPTAKLHINNTTSGNTFLAEDSTNPDSSPFLIDSSGNVGIGTLTPTAKLQVKVNDFDPVNYGFAVSDSGNTSNYFAVNNVGQVGIRTPYTGSNNQFIITNTNPSFSNAQVRFNVSGDYAFSMLDNQGYGFSSSPSSISINTRSTQGNINIWTQAGNTTRLNLGGQDINPTVARTRTIISPVNSSTTAFVPTGGTAVDYSFENVSNLAFQPTGGTATYTQIQLRPTYNTTGAYSGTVRGLYYNPILTSLSGATHRAIETTTGDVIFGSTSGNVGIGTTTPTAKLHINNTTSGNTFLVEDDTNPDSTPFVIDASGNTGIGTLTPLTKLDVVGGDVALNSNRLFLGQYLGNQVLRIIETSNLQLFNSVGTLYLNAGNSVVFGSNNSNSGRWATFFNNGNLLIQSGGTHTDAGFKLDVIGNTRISGDTIISSGLSASTVTITTQPTSGYTSTEILMRNSTTGQVEITDSTSPSIYNYGMSYAMTTFNYLT